MRLYTSRVSRCRELGGDGGSIVGELCREELGRRSGAGGREDVEGVSLREHHCVLVCADPGDGRTDICGAWMIQAR